MNASAEELPERKRAQDVEALMLPTGEFVALLAAAILLLGIVFGFVSPSLPII